MDGAWRMIERAETQDEGSSPLIRALEEVKECTPPLARFVQEFCDLMGLFSSFISMATRLDDRKGMTKAVPARFESAGFPKG